MTTVDDGQFSREQGLRHVADVPLLHRLTFADLGINDGHFDLPWSFLCMQWGANQ